ncbi:MAG TPA: flavin reductase family protein [Burkholderiaceae bacterium]|nr:flavin reductase family protein [Burkholderiaceae bacterium]
MQAQTASSTDFRKALAQFATGVTIITTRTGSGAPVGLTANSFSSVSLDPPLVLWSLALSSATMPVFRTCERYLVHVLAHHQLDLARRFAARGAERFDADNWHFNGSGLPYLPGCVAWFECSIRSRYEEGDHVILVGRVEAFRYEGGKPLIFHDGRYVAELTEAPLPRALRSGLG